MQDTTRTWNLDRPCPSWCTNCTGWEGHAGEDGRTHRHFFAFRDMPNFVEIYASERRDGTLIAFGCDVRQSPGMGVVGLRMAAAILEEAAAFMEQNGVAHLPNVARSLNSFV